MSPIHRLLRPAILLAAGVLLGQGAIAVATPAAPAATTQTRTASCSGLDFHPVDSRTEYRFDGRWLYRSSYKTDGWFFCPANLPDRAVVKKVSFTLRDVTDAETIRYCALARLSLVATDGRFEAMATVAETGMAATPGDVRRSDTSIQTPTIDNAKWAYAYQCQIVYGPIETTTDAQAGIGGASVTFSISAANG